MSKNIYIIRHCEAEGQSANSPLTEKGFVQANELSNFLADVKVDRIISSPFLRAVQTIKPFAEKKKIDIEMEGRLTERILSSIFYSDWMEKLEATFEDLNLKYEGGESSNEAKNRIIGVVNDILASDAEHTIVVAHGGIISLLLNHYDKNFGFEQWKALGNPDIYLLSHSQNDVAIKRLWEN
ncbi:histidine phosphatase family protein [Lederbergia galactosidilytica]|uniref:Phosphoglycerate mutase n=1 Tax=Lederbergia galactosidilytica TaxID=217031 RepID=A0A177ZRX4_9BACI|nr:histidine phosphatase family protein [Lederbergia galactosidilytica]KRG13718.1 phosphoglycerate mutase [Virgibacillus soli]MBP1916273.1 2,3-bisphosphoglycerate-dependent phosphoglycerate mutase [Lederbergia galactosidilytica]OAK70711.1 phosphoglycerate mutase [Lederbergia galactosidilytica]